MTRDRTRQHTANRRTGLWLAALALLFFFAVMLKYQALAP